MLTGLLSQNAIVPVWATETAEHTSRGKRTNHLSDNVELAYDYGPTVSMDIPLGHILLRYCCDYCGISLAHRLSSGHFITHELMRKVYVAETMSTCDDSLIWSF